MFLTEEEITIALDVLMSTEQQLRTGADVTVLAAHWLHIPIQAWYPADYPYPQYAVDVIKKLNGPHGKTYAATILTKYCT